MPPYLLNKRWNFELININIYAIFRRNDVFIFVSYITLYFSKFKTSKDNLSYSSLKPVPSIVNAQ